MNTRLTPVLVSHFLIDLQEANKASTGGQTSLSVLSQMDSLNFARASSEGIASFGSYIPAPWEARHNEEGSESQDGDYEGRAVEVEAWGLEG